MSDDEIKTGPESAPDAAETAGAEAAHAGVSVGGAVAHLVGISRPQDEYGAAPSDRDAMSDAALLAMGVEPDASPGALISATFGALVVGLLVVCVGVAAAFNLAVQAQRAQVGGGQDPTIAAARAAGEAELEQYERIEHSEAGARNPVGYQVPIDVGMNMLIDNPRLLARHPLGVRNPADIPLPPNAPPEPPPAPSIPPGFALIPGDGGALQLVGPDGVPVPFDPSALQLAAPGGEPGSLQLQLQLAPQ